MVEQRHVNKKASGELCDMWVKHKWAQLFPSKPNEDAVNVFISREL